jgi:hypothetical protein
VVYKTSVKWLKFTVSMKRRWAGHIERMGKNRTMYRSLVGKPEGTTPLGKPRSRWMDNIKMDHGVVWTGLVWLRLGRTE